MTEFAKAHVLRWDQSITKKGAVIPHGFNEIFLDRTQYTGNFNLTGPIKLLYVSSILPYKHQLNVSKAVVELYNEGYNINLQLIGHSGGRYGKEILRKIRKMDVNSVVNYIPEIENKDLKKYYHDSDIFIFGSSCETFGIILLEAMASGLPIICSDQGALKETLGQAGIYFDPLNYLSIKDALIKYLNNSNLMNVNRNAAVQKSKDYSWKNTAISTFKLFNHLVNNH